MRDYHRGRRRLLGFLQSSEANQRTHKRRHRRLLWLVRVGVRDHRDRRRDLLGRQQHLWDSRERLHDIQRRARAGDWPTSGAKAVSVGCDMACAITSEDSVVCWGNNITGQLGTGTRTTAEAPAQSTPVQVSGLTSGVLSVSVGHTLTCVIRTGGAVVCWEYGVPTPVPGLESGVVAVSAGSYQCAVKGDGSLWCWPRLTFQGPLTQVPGLESGVPAFSAGYDSACAVKAGGGGRLLG